MNAGRVQQHWIRAFTLIELLVVMVIIAILAAIVFPVTILVRSRMDSAQCLSQLRQIGVAVGGYINDNDNTMPGPLSFKQSAVYTPGQPGSLAALLENYLGTANSIAPDGSSRFSQLFVCPAAARRLQDPTKPTYIVNFLPSPEHGQCIWGDLTLNQKPLRKTALVNWNDANTNGSSVPLNLAQIWAIQDGDQYYAAQVASSMSTGPVGDLLPTQAHGDHWNDLFFDFHSGSRNSLIAVDSPGAPTPAPGGP